MFIVRPGAHTSLPAGVKLTRSLGVGCRGPWHPLLRRRGQILLTARPDLLPDPEAGQGERAPRDGTDVHRVCAHINGPEPGLPRPEEGRRAGKRNVPLSTLAVLNALFIERRVPRERPEAQFHFC